MRDRQPGVGNAASADMSGQTVPGGITASAVSILLSPFVRSARTWSASVSMRRVATGR